MRRLLRDIAEGRALGDVTTLRDPDVVARLGEAIAAAATRSSRPAELRPGVAPLRRPVQAHTFW